MKKSIVTSKCKDDFSPERVVVTEPTEPLKKHLAGISFSNLKLAAKLFIAFSLVFLAMITIMCVSSNIYRSIALDEAAVFQVEIPVCQKLECLSANARRMRLAIQMLILVDDPTGKDKEVAEIEELTNDNQKIILKLKQMLLQDHNMLARLESIEKTLNRFYQRNREILIPLAYSQKDQSAKVTILRNERVSIERLERLADELSQTAEEFAQNRMKASLEKAEASIRWLWALTVVSMVFTAGLVFVLAKWIVEPLERLTKVAREIAMENPFVQIVDQHRSDEVGVLARSLAYMLDSLRKRSQERDDALNDLARSNADLQQLAYVAAHDLKEPLRTLTSYLSLLSERIGDGLDPKGRKYMNNAIEGAARLDKLVLDLLTYARLGKKSLEREPVNMNEVLKQVTDSLSVLITETSALIEFDELPIIYGEISQLTQLLQNLIQNAIKFRGDKPPKIAVRAKKEVKEWIFTVKDHGIGFDMQFQERIFIIFQRLHTRSEYPGTGLGLAVCKRIVERHGGRIWAESSNGDGATFFFSIPSEFVKEFPDRITGRE